MSEQAKDGGPAFPKPGFAYPNGNVEYPEFGMSLRDWFAGQALAGRLANSTCEGSYQLFVLEAYMFADAMLAERAKEPKS